MILSKPIRMALEWSEEDDDGLARRPTILGGLGGEVEGHPSVSVGLAPRVPSLGALGAMTLSLPPPRLAELRGSCRPTRRAPPLGRELAPVRGSVRPTARPSQFPF